MLNEKKIEGMFEISSFAAFFYSAIILGYSLHKVEDGRHIKFHLF